jgi:hypothetical protein
MDDEIAVVTEEWQAERLLSRLRSDTSLRARTRQLVVEWPDGATIPPSVYISRVLPHGYVTAEQLAELADALCDVDVLSVCELWLCTSLLGKPETFLPLRNLRHLEIVGASFSLRYPWENLAKLLPSLAQLRSIHIYAAESNGGSETEDEPSLSSLSLSSSSSSALVDAPFSLVEARLDSCTLLRAKTWDSLFRNSVSTLRRLSLTGCDFSRRVVELVGPWLEELCLADAFDELDAHIGPALSSCKRLKRLSLGQRFASPTVLAFINEAPLVQLSLHPLYPWTSVDLIQPLTDGALPPTLRDLFFTPPPMVISPETDWDDDDRRAVEAACRERHVRVHWMN